MENDSMVACCALCCLDCHAHTGRIPDLARDLIPGTAQGALWEICRSPVSLSLWESVHQVQGLLWSPRADDEVPTHKGVQGEGRSAVLQDQEVLPGQRDSGLLGMWRISGLRKTGFPERGSRRCTPEKSCTYQGERDRRIPRGKEELVTGVPAPASNSEESPPRLW